MSERGLGYVHRPPTWAAKVGSAVRSRRVAKSFEPTRHPPFQLLWGNSEPLDQGVRQSCTGYFLARAAELVILATWSIVLRLSPLALYAWGRGRYDDVLIDSGAYTGDVVWACNTIGWCPDEAWPSRDSTEWHNADIVNERPGMTAAMRAKKLRREYPIAVKEIVDTGDRLVERILHSLDLGQLVGIAIPVGEEFLRGDKLLDAELTNLGYHQVAILDWRKVDSEFNAPGVRFQFLIGNSWGRFWGGTDSPAGTQWCTAALVKQSIHTCYLQAIIK